MLPAAYAQGGCSPLHFVWARATTEPPTGVDNANAAQFEAAAARYWSKGYGAAGYSIYTNVTSLIPDATGYPVHYPASFSGCSSENKGIADLVSQLTTQAERCPEQKFALGGHSQGGVVLVRAIPQIPAAVQQRVIAITMVGSPNCPTSVKGKCKSYCNEGDSICSASGTGSSGRCNTRRNALVDLFQSDPEYVDGVLDLRSTSDLEARAAPDCSQPEPAEKGHRASGGSAHLAYSADGFYTRAAACYILRAFTASQGVA
ncbi:alpha/beta-hydrolase [Eremomyces bilateralis CBS 781.70]|uniref:Alpha/beta-hydrolase n=1 Tax=Eremomyces bilateralis CBS 781.70 TaxID=1392243 RepID=A0A6G1FV28_9PEZI|nr:alpha/beta-hydrolase [Eremomyces bilateralis CBS 781.70]KAF1809511.1 alpha/beta-hydrolase [Eremomyces bilateralis CBS 781.70]